MSGKLRTFENDDLKENGLAKHRMKCYLPIDINLRKKDRMISFRNSLCYPKPATSPSSRIVSAFGMTEQSGNDEFFTGKPYIGELGYAFLFRNYCAEQDKWQTSDPLGYPDGWNNLAYVNNHIISSFDVQGLCEKHYVGNGEFYYEECDNFTRTENKNKTLYLTFPSKTCICGFDEDIALLEGSPRIISHYSYNYGKSCSSHKGSKTVDFACTITYICDEYKFKCMYSRVEDKDLTNIATTVKPHIMSTVLCCE